MPDKYQLLGPLAPDDYERLKDDIVANGVAEPVVVDEAGEIIDGHNRAMIADSIGIEYPRRTVAGLSESEKRRLALRLNLNRRHMTDFQKAAAATLIEEEEKAAAKDRMATGGKQGAAQTNAARWGTPVGGCSIEHPPTKGTGNRGNILSRDRMAAAVGVGSGITLQRHMKVVEEAAKEAPDLHQDGLAGKKNVSQVKRELGRRRKESAAKDAAPRKPKRTAAPMYPLPEVKRLFGEMERLLEHLRTINAHRTYAQLAAGIEGPIMLEKMQAMGSEWAMFTEGLAEATSAQRPELRIVEGGKPSGRATG